MIHINHVGKVFKIPDEHIRSLKGSIVKFFSPKTYRKFSALQDIKIHIREHEFFGVIGKNGSGKSTLLKIISGIYQPSSGSVEVNAPLSAFLELGVGFNFELTARDNIFLYGAIIGLSRKSITEKFDDIIAFAEVEQFVNTKLNKFSSGMLTRLSFSIAMHADTPILLIDEVLAVGDKDFQEKCAGVFKKLKDKGKTIVYVSHDLDSIRTFCDRVALLDEGKLVAVGTPDEVIGQYEGERH